MTPARPGRTPPTAPPCRPRTCAVPSGRHGHSPITAARPAIGLRGAVSAMCGAVSACAARHRPLRPATGLHGPPPACTARHRPVQRGVGTGPAVGACGVVPARVGACGAEPARASVVGDIAAPARHAGGPRRSSACRCCAGFMRAQTSVERRRKTAHRPTCRSSVNGRRGRGARTARTSAATLHDSAVARAFPRRPDSPARGGDDAPAGAGAEMWLTETLLPAVRDAADRSAQAVRGC